MIYIIPAIYVRMGMEGLTGLWMGSTVSDVLGAVLAFALMLTQRKVFRTGLKTGQETGPET